MFRFTIRDVLWLTVVVGIGVGWSVDHRAQRVALGNRLHLLYEQEADLQTSEYWLLEIPESEFDIDRLKEWAKDRRNKRLARQVNRRL